MTNTDTETTHTQAKLNAIEDGLAQFILNSDFSRNTKDSSDSLDENTFFWPVAKLPEGIELGDTVNISLELTNKEERIIELQKKKQQELKYDEMRKLLEELVN
ncbi:hypothetical protein J7J83_04200 [bacterium]|nr:hypothetical protein [bacterium]